VKKLCILLTLGAAMLVPALCPAEDVSSMRARADSLEVLRADLVRQLAEVERLLESLQIQLAELELETAAVEGGVHTMLARPGKVRATPSTRGEPLAELAKGEVVEVLGYPEKGYWLVRSGTSEGYVGSLYLDLNDAMRQMRDDFDYANLPRAERARREMLLEKYGESTGARLVKRELWIGMSLEMLLDSRDIPSSMNSTTTATELQGQICWGEPLPNLCVYLVNNVVTSWQRFSP
jgi:hypothetical protein